MGLSYSLSFPSPGFSFFFLPPSTKKTCSHFCEIESSEGEKMGWGGGGGGTMKFNPFKTVSFSDNIAQGTGCLSARLEKQRSPVIVSSKSAEL